MSSCSRPLTFLQKRQSSRLLHHHHHPSSTSSVSLINVVSSILPSSNPLLLPHHHRPLSTSTIKHDDNDDDDDDAPHDNAAAAFLFKKAVLARHSTKAFDPDRALPHDTLTSILSLTLRAPTSFNVQPYTVTVVESKEMRHKLAACMLGPNKARVLQAPVTAVFAADLGT